MADHATKRCIKCGEVKPLDGFYPRRDSPDGYRNDCRECLIARSRRYYETHPRRAAETKRRYQVNRKKLVFAYYGESCACCGAPERLSIDHVNGDGHAHRKELFGGSQGRASSGFYHWLVTNGFPPGYQTLCRSCNSSKGRGARCVLDHAMVLERL